jgi:hypothetical protein
MSRETSAQLKASYIIPAENEAKAKVPMQRERARILCKAVKPRLLRVRALIYAPWKLDRVKARVN